MPAPNVSDNCFEKLQRLGFKSNFFDNMKKFIKASEKRKDLLLTSGHLTEEYIRKLWPLLTSVEKVKVIYNQQFSSRLIDEVFPGMPQEEQEGMFRKQHKVPVYVFDRLWNNDTKAEDFTYSQCNLENYVGSSIMNARRSFILEQFIVPESYLLLLWNGDDNNIRANRIAICRYQPLSYKMVEEVWSRCGSNKIKKLLLQHQTFEAYFYASIINKAITLNELGEI